MKIKCKHRWNHVRAQLTNVSVRAGSIRTVRPRVGLWLDRAEGDGRGWNRRSDDELVEVGQKRNNREKLETEAPKGG